MTESKTANELPRVEDYRSDLTAGEIQAARITNTRSIAMQAYLQAFPAFLHMRQLTEFIQGRRYLTPGENPLCGWFLMRKLSDTTTKTVSPNVDTLYGATYAFLDQQGPMVLHVPPIFERYYSVAVLDAYFNNFAVISPRTYGNDGGDYLLVPPKWKGKVPARIKDVFTAPTPIINLFQRIYTRGESEYSELHILQDAIRLIPLDQWGKTEVVYKEANLTPYEIKDMRMTRDALKFFEYTNFYTGVNPPPDDDSGLSALFQTAGVGPGSSLPVDHTLREAITHGAADAQALINARITEGSFRAGWTVPDPNIGRSGQHILNRAACQLTQLGAFPNEEAIYFFALRDSEAKRLNGQNRYTVTFPKGQLPPLQQYGFWSLTMYNESFLLVENPLNRYILRPGSSDFTFSADGSLTLYLQADKPQNFPEGNWLPAPKGDFSVALRTYLPHADIMDGTWFPPGIVKV